MYAITYTHSPRVWVVMSSYNSINGVTASENDLLETPLNSEWGFDGVVVSDWTAVRSVAAASASQDLAMPGPDGAWGAALVEAVRDGRVSEAAIDRKVARLLTLAQRVGALESYAGGPADAGGLLRVEDGVAFAREAAAEGTVLLANDGVLPLDAARLQRVAVIGQNAVAARTQGGGSATVIPERVVSPWEGIVAALPDAEVTYRLGAVATMGITALPLAELTNPSTGGPGVLVRFLDDAGVELMSGLWLNGDVRDSPLFFSRDMFVAPNRAFVGTDRGVRAVGLENDNEVVINAFLDEQFVGEELRGPLDGIRRDGL